VEISARGSLRRRGETFSFLNSKKLLLHYYLIGGKLYLQKQSLGLRVKGRINYNRGRKLAFVMSIRFLLSYYVCLRKVEIHYSSRVDNIFNAKDMIIL